MNTLTIKAKAGAGASGGGEDKRLKKNYEFILIYAKDYNFLTYKVPLEKTRLIDYIEDHKINNIGFYYTRVITNYGNRKFLGNVLLGNGETMAVYEHENFEFSSVSKLSKIERKSESEIYNQYFENIFMVTNAQTSLLTRVNNFVKEKGKLISYEYIPSTGKKKGQLETKLVWNETLVVWLKDSAIKENDAVYKTEKIGTLWTSISWGRLDLEGGVSFKGGKKPEALVSKIVDMATEPNDLVLDSFLGSGTTAAVAHKMGRRYIGIEMGNHAYTHCKARLDKVISGEDKGGITKVANWTSGGGYKFYELAPTLILQDDFGQEIINPEYNAEMLASAVALHEGYTYAPDENCYFKQAYNGNNAYLYVTTRHIDKSAVNSILTQLQDNEYLIIVCKSFDSNAAEDAKNITLKKIPQSLLDNCEFGKDDYKLNIVNPPVYEDEETEDNE